jgi:hypothetical protein
MLIQRNGKRRTVIFNGTHIITPVVQGDTLFLSEADGEYEVALMLQDIEVLIKTLREQGSPKMKATLVPPLPAPSDWIKDAAREDKERFAKSEAARIARAAPPHQGASNRPRDALLPQMPLPPHLRRKD